ncbi:Holliday junction branch migration protein RuvA [Trueperella abortisuis]|uniref:Holliday junction branch migration complex subunit RuvA n=1 Tax=Trueperella abortisuis TaxID=445930 RepID=A0ABT9PJK7_9ACTO|nr:Holliday junction branch migration protein RuvA [Trueperella abortisuis]MDP9832335.1 Holliday junction DNA helicase RuvA [Trueperella abortisuis]
MIVSLRGPVLRVTATAAVIEAGGVGYLFSATPDTLAKLREGQEAFVHIAMVTSREGEQALFGFHDDDARATFDVLRSVTGIGPRSALTIVATLPPDELRRAIETKDEAALVRIPGVGKKSAQRMVLELAGKLGPAVGGEPASASASSSADDVIAALVGMGWKERDAASALAEAMKTTPSGTLAQLLRASLQVLGQRR